MSKQLSGKGKASRQASPSADRPGAASGIASATDDRFRLTYYHAPIGIEQISLRDGRLLDINPRLCEILGYSRDELLRKSFAQITNPADLRDERKLLKQLLAGEIRSYTIEKRYLHKDGHPVWVRVTSSNASENGSHAYRISVVEDITARKQAEQEQARLAAIVESSDDAILSKDLDGTVLTWNRGAERLLGYSRDEIVGRPVTLVVPPDRLDEERQIIERIRRGQRVDHYETVRRRKDGARVDVALSVSPIRDAAGRIVGASTIARDITEARRSEAARLDIEARMRAIVTAAVDAIVTIDERGLVKSANPATEKLFGYTEAELLGKNVKVLMPEPYYSEHDEYLRKYLRTGQRKIIGIGREVTGRRKDGSTFPLRLAVSEVRLAGRRLFTGIIHDLTGRRRLEREILEASANEQRRIGQDLHDGICQELVGIGFSAELLARQLEAEALPHADAAARIGNAVRHVASEARKLSHGLNPIDVAAGGLPVALEGLATRVSESFRISCTFSWDGSANVQDATSATHLYRIAQEATSNAIKHGKADRVQIRLVGAADRLVLTIRDSGKGFPATSSAALQTLNSRLHNGASPYPKRAAGMGLHTMNYRARMIGGDFDVRPGSPQGTLVTCSLRLASANVPTNESSAGNRTKRAARKDRGPSQRTRNQQSARSDERRRNI